jgi:hypothetical protein
MDESGQVAQFGGLYALILLITIYLSVGIAVGLGRLSTGLPRALAIVARHWQGRDSATLGGATIGVILLCFFHIPPVVFLVWPSSHIAVAARLLSAVLFAAEAGWFLYLRRHSTAR